MSRLFFLLILLLELLSAGNSLAFDCKKASTKVEKLICEKNSLIRLDEDYVKDYKQAVASLSVEKRKVFADQIKELLEARNECVNLYGKPIASVEVKNSLSEPFKIYQINKESFVTGCVATWYRSVSSAINLNQKNPYLFKVPSREEYVRSFNALKDQPYAFEISETNQDKVKSCKEAHKDRPNFDCSGMKSDFSTELTYKLFFPTRGKKFSQIIDSQYSYHAGAAHGQSSGSLNFLINNSKTIGIDNSAYACSIPITDPVVVGGDIYLPEQISLTEFFKKMLGEYSEFQCYACAGIYQPDCLMKLRNLDKDDSYIVFNSAVFINDLASGDDEISPKAFRKCALEVIKNHQSKVEGLKKILHFENGEPIFIKESASQSILGKIKKDCRKYGKSAEKLNQSQCLKLTEKNPSFNIAVGKVFKLESVAKFSDLLRKDGNTLTALTYSPEFQDNKCYWLFRFHENHPSSHMVFWKEFLVEVNGDKVCSRSISDELCEEEK